MNVLQQIEEHQELREAAQIIKVACAKCREWVANAKIGDLSIPFTGAMFERRVGCEHWEMPPPDAKGMGLVCPHSVTGDPADLHLFIPHVAGKEEEADELYLYGKAGFIKVWRKTIPEPEPEIELCDCGCGREPTRTHKDGNRYATQGCHMRWVFQQDRS